MRLFHNQHCLFRYVEMARVTGVPMEYLLNKGRPWNLELSPNNAAKYATTYLTIKNGDITITIEHVDKTIKENNYPRKRPQTVLGEWEDNVG